MDTTRTPPATPPVATPRPCAVCGSVPRGGANFCLHCGSRLTARAGAVLVVGSPLQGGRYTIVRLLGQGGGGAVYLADDARLGRRCVVKEALSLFASSAERQQAEADFAREALILARLSTEHGGLPQTYDYFTEASRHYLVMQYIDGETLEDRLRRAGGPLPVDEVVRCAAAVAEILATLHAQQPEPVIHRDVKPANIIVDSGGRVKLVDFGLAKAVTAVPLQAAQHTTAAGTAGYTPLEQWAGQAEPRSDVYALGATMHHLLTGRDPRDAFDAQPVLNLDVLKRLGTFPPLRSLRPDVPPALDTLVRRMLDSTPAERPSAEEVERALIRLGVSLARRTRTSTPAAVPILAPDEPAPAPPTAVQAFAPLAREALAAEINGWLRQMLANLPADEPLRLVRAAGELVPVALRDYQIAARFESSVGQLISFLDSAGTLLLDGTTGRVLEPALAQFITAQRAYLLPLDSALAAGDPPLPHAPFRASARKLDEQASAQIIVAATRTVRYTAGNGRSYSKVCKPQKKHLTLPPPLLLYVPRWTLTVELRGRTYTLEAWQVGAAAEAPVGARLYISSSTLPGGAFCPGCGSIVAPATLVPCATCGKQVCPRCTITRTRLGFFRKTYCSAVCAR